MWDLIPRAGGLNWINREKLDLIAAKLPFLVIRNAIPFHENEHPKLVDPSSNEARARPTLVQLRSPREKADLDRAGRAPWPASRAMPGDKPLADFLWMQLCEDQERGRDKITVFPPPISETGLIWPSEERIAKLKAQKGQPVHHG